MMDNNESKIVDPRGRVLETRPAAAMRRLRQFTKTTKAFIAVTATFLAFSAGVIVNLDRITGFFSSSGSTPEPAGADIVVKQTPQTPKRSTPQTPNTPPINSGGISSVVFFNAFPPSPPFDNAIKEIEQFWPGEWKSVRDATIANFISEIEKPYSIIHIEVNVSYGDLEFTDGTLSGNSLARALKARSVETRCVVLAFCNSFQIGKALEHANVKYSVVVTRYLSDRTYETFFLEFYTQLSKGQTVPIAYERAHLKTELALKDRFNSPFEGNIVLTTYGSPEGVTDGSK